MGRREVIPRRAIQARSFDFSDVLYDQFNRFPLHQDVHCEPVVRSGNGEAPRF